MDDLQVLDKCLRSLKEAYGDEIYEIVNFDYILQQEALLAWLRPFVERNIAMNYLPGFEFSDMKRFSWHLRKEQHYQSILFGGRMPPEKFTSTWIRRFLVPKRHHYIAEVALAFQKQAESSREFRKHFPNHSRRMGWVSLMRRWIAIKDTMRGYTLRSGDGVPWSKRYSKVSDGTILRWARKAREYRAARRASSPANYWQISHINYTGKELINADKIFEHVSLIDTNYLETWKWFGEDSEPSPKRNSPSFMLPASLDTWDAYDRKG